MVSLKFVFFSVFSDFFGAFSAFFLPSGSGSTSPASTHQNVSTRADSTDLLYTGTH